jgi:hypothetical protein
VNSDSIAGQPPPQSADRDHLDRLLDEALAATFPASDPVAICSGGQGSQAQVAKEDSVEPGLAVRNQDSSDTQENFHDSKRESCLARYGSCG